VFSRVFRVSPIITHSENGQSYPDITLIPVIATIFGVDANYLFGKKEEDSMQVQFPQTYKGLPLAHSTNTVACYSNKTVEKKDATGVKFTDGSVAELTTRLVTNTGAGEVRFLDAQEWKQDGTAQSQYEETDATDIITRTFEFGYTENVDITVLANECKLVTSTDGKTHVTATLEKRYMKRLRVEENDKTIRVLFLNENNFFGKLFNLFNEEENNKIVIAIPCTKGCRADVKINGSGNFRSEIESFEEGELFINGSGSITMADFNECEASVNGSGEITLQRADDFRASVNGSGDIHCAETQTANAQVNGSGDVDIKNAAYLSASVNGSGDLTVEHINGGDFSAKVNGSGDIHVKGGHCEKFDAEVHGSGDIDAAPLTARKASIIVYNSGTVTLGRVLEGSTEQVKKSGEIRILKRGAEN